MKSKILKVASFCLLALLGADVYGFHTINNAMNQPDANRYELTPLLGFSDNLDMSVLNAMQEMQNAPDGEYRFHTAAKNNGNIMFFAAYDLMRNVGDCGFDTLSLNRATFADMFSNAFADEAWRAYSGQQRNDLSSLLKDVLRYWIAEEDHAHQLMNVSAQEVFGNIVSGRSQYNPNEHHAILVSCINTLVRENRPNGKLVSDLHDTHISLISYITGSRIITSSDNGLLEHLSLRLNINLNTAIDTIVIHNTGNHWLRSYMLPNISNYVGALRRYGISEGNALVEAVLTFQIPHLHFPDSWTGVPDMIYNNGQVNVFYKN